MISMVEVVLVEWLDFFIRTVLGEGVSRSPALSIKRQFSTSKNREQNIESKVG